MNFAKKQSDNLEQQETSPSCALQSPLERVLSLLRPRTAPTELRALVVEEQEDLETDDEGLISFEEERVRGCPRICGVPGPSCVPAQGAGAGCHGTGSHPMEGTREGSLGGGPLSPPGQTPAPAALGVLGRADSPCPAQPLSPARLCPQAQLSFNTDTLC